MESIEAKGINRKSIAKEEGNKNSLHNNMRCKSLFDNSPIPTYQSNVSNVVKEIKRIKAEGVEQIADYIADQPAFITELFHITDATDVNDAMLNLTEAKSKAHFIHNFKRILGQSFFNFFEEVVTSLFYGKVILSGDTEINTFTGKKIWVRATAIYNLAENEEFVNCTFVEITDKKLKDEAIKLINQRLVMGDFQEHMNNLVLALSEAFSLSHVFIGKPDAKMEKITTFAFSAHQEIQENVTYDLKKSPCYEIYDSQQKVIYTNHIDKIYPNNNAIKTWGGKSYMGYPLLDKEGNIMGHFSFLNNKSLGNIDALQDVMELYASWASTELEQLSNKKALTKTEARLDNVVHSIGDVFYIFDLDFKIIAYNKVCKTEFARLFDIRLEKGKTAFENGCNLTKTEIRKKVKTSKLVFQGQVISEIEAFPINGDVEYYTTTYSPMRDELGKIVGCIVISKNITELRKTEKALKQRNRIIEQQVIDLDNKNKELQKYIESNEQLENFAYIASHDLKAPIRTIISFSQLLARGLKDKLDNDSKEYLEFIMSASRNMRDLIDSLLDYSRINSNPIRLSNVSVDYLLSLIQHEISATIRDSNATVEWRNLPTQIQGDFTKFKQLFQNLITNAIKFHKETEPPVILIDCVEQATAWHFTVADNGIGIKEEYFDRIFVLFQKLHIKTEYEGTGLGLAICKTIVEQHKGKIWVESAIGEGTTFHFTIGKKI